MTANAEVEKIFSSICANLLLLQDLMGQGWGRMRERGIRKILKAWFKLLALPAHFLVNEESARLFCICGGDIVILFGQ